MSKSIDIRNQVCPPVFADENDVAMHGAQAKGGKSAFGNPSAMMAMKKLAASKMAESKSSSSSGKKSGAFGRLLTDVGNEQKIEQSENDEKLAMEIQCDEALSMASQWMQLDADEEMAKAVAKDLEKEIADEKSASIKQGESAALKVAIEERRKMQAEAAQKVAQEKADTELAKKSVLDDVEEAHNFKVLCEKDDEVAAKIHAQLQDEILAEELQKKEDKAFEELKEQQRIKDNERAQHDFELARQTQINLDVHAAESKSALEKKDAAIALEMAISTSREEHRRRKRLEVVHSNVVFNSIQKVSKQWEEAEADVEDVAGGLCLTLLLPYLRDIKLKASTNNTVDLEAFRIISAEERKRELDTEENSQYCAEFLIDGNNVSIEDRDLSFEYSSESGLLHVYVESVHLDNAPATAEAKDAKDVPVNNPSKTTKSVNKSSTVVGSIANGLKVLFSRQ